MQPITSAQVQFLTLAYFGRPADPASLSAWPATGLTANAVVLRFVNTDEWRLNTIARNTSGNTLDQTGLINTYYNRLFGRNAQASEVAGWTNALATGAVNVDYLGITILNAGLNLPVSTDIRRVLDSKFESAQRYTGILFNNSASAAAYNGAAAIANGISYLTEVKTAVPATNEQAAAAVAALPSGGGTGQTFTLTTGADNVSGDVATINGTYLQAGAAGTFTLQNFDVINTSNASATANINLLNTAAVLNLTNITVLNGVRTVNLTNANGEQAVNGGIIPNATALTIASNGVAATGITATAVGASLASFTLTGNRIATRDNSITFNAGTRNTSTDTFTFNTSGNITTAGAAIGNFDLVGGAATEGIEIVNIVATGGNNLSRVRSQGSAGANLMTTLNISGAGAVIIGGTTAFAGTTSTINASTNTGGAELTVGTSVTTFTGGSGDDVLRFFAAGDFTSADVLNFGGGTSNVLVLADTTIGASSTAALNSAINAVTTAQIVGLGANSTTIDMSRITQNRVELFSTGNTIQNLEASDSVVVLGFAAGATVASASLGFNTLNIALLATADLVPTVASIGTLNATNQSTINISTGSLGSVAVTNTIGAITNSTNATVTLTGAAALTITSFSAAVAVNGSALTRALFLTVADGVNSAVTGGSANDTLVSGTGSDTLIGGAGVDTFTVGVTAGNGARYQGGLGADLISLDAVTGTRTATLASTAAESFASTGNFDIVTFADTTFGGIRTLTTSTGVTATAVTAATSVTLGTTSVAANAFLIVNAAGLATANAQNAIAYQDSNGNGVIDSTDYATSFIIGGTDTLAFALSSGQLQVTYTGV